MDTFDIEPDFKINRYLPNRRTLENLCGEFHVATVVNPSRTVNTTVPRPKTNTSNSERTTTAYASSQNQQSTGNRVSHEKGSEKGPNQAEWGCMIGLVLFVAVLLVINFCHSRNTNHSSENYECVDSDTVDVDMYGNPVPTFDSEQEGYIVDETSNDDGMDYPEATSALDSEPDFERQSTGSRPYAYYYGSPQGGDSNMTFKTSSGSDYVVIVRDAATDEVVNHVYIQGGDKWSISVPNGAYNVYFYSGTGWVPDKDNGNVTGGFYYNENIQKDYVSLSYQGVTYTLYTVRDGNLQLQHASASETF